MIPMEQRFFKFVDKKTDNECWLWIGTKDMHGYGKFSLKAKKIGSHRISYEIHKKEKIPTGKVLMHTCDNPACVNPNHLVLGSYSENAVDMVRKNRSRVCFLNEVQVLEIKRSYLSIRDLSTKYNVSSSCIRDIKKKRTWKHLE
jgi:hypothetical protein